MDTIDPTPSGADVALLGLLAEGAMHPWEISRQVDYREMRTWTDLARSTVYKQLRSLEQRGLVQGTEEIVSGRARRTYQLTEEGRGALFASLGDVGCRLADPPPGPAEHHLAHRSGFRRRRGRLPGGVSR